MADPYLAALRSIHVATAVFWAGATFAFAGFHDFVVGADDREATLDRLVGYANASQYVGVSGLVAVLSGLLLYWHVSGGIADWWLASTYGRTITAGAVAGLAAIVVGIVMVGLTNNRIEALAAEVGSDGGMSDEHRERLDGLRTRLHRGERWVAALLLVAVLAMAAAQSL